MPWCEKKPGYIASIEEVELLCATESSGKMAAAYARLFRGLGNRAPAFRDLDLKDVASAVPHMALCSVGFGTHCTIRFFGEELKSRVGVNPVGRNLFDFVHPDRADSIRQVMEMLVRYPCGYLANVKQEYTSGRTIIVETLALPLLRSREPDDGQVVLCDTPIGNVGTTLERERVLLSADIVNRDLIDLGFGVDEDFRDLIAEQP